MDNKNFFRALLWAMLVFFLWQMLAMRIWPPAKPSPLPTTGNGAATPGAVTAEAPPVGTNGAPAASPAPVAPGVFVATGAPSPEQVTLGDVAGAKESPYRMQLTLDSRGAAIEKLLLSDHAAHARTKERYTLLAPHVSGGKTWRSYAVELLTIDGAHPIDLETVAWRVDRPAVDNADAARFTATIAQDGQPVLELARTYTLPKQESTLGRSDFFVDLAIRNLTDQPRQVIVRESGPVGLHAQGSVLPDQKIFAATKEEEGYVTLFTRTFVDIGKRTDKKIYPRNPQEPHPLLWWGGANQYFTFTVAPPLPPDTGELPQFPFAGVVEGVDFDADKKTRDDVTSRYTTRAIALPAQGSVTLPAAVYAGAKDREAFQDPANVDYVLRGYMQQIREAYGSCSFNFLTDGMIWLLNKLEAVFQNFGVAIIFLVLIVRAILHPITKRTQVNMMRMQQNMATIQPKLDELRKRFGNEPMKLNQEMMKLYREEGVSPVGQMTGCLPIFLQMPIWIALYSSLRNNVAMRGRGFILWINDLTTPDHLVSFDQPVDLPLIGHITGFHLLPILVGVLMFAQQKLMPKPKKPVTTAPQSPQAQQAEQMQKIMPYMSLIMIPIFYGVPSGLNLYIMVSSLIGTFEQLYIRKHITKAELDKPAHKPKPAKARKGPSLLEKLMKHAEEAQKIKSTREDKPKR